MLVYGELQDEHGEVQVMGPHLPARHVRRARRAALA